MEGPVEGSESMRFSSANTPSSPRLSPSACKAANRPTFSRPPAPDDLLCPPSAVVPSSDSPSAETRNTILVRNRYTQLPPTPRHRLPYRLKLPPPSSALAPASISLALLPNLYLPTSSILPASYHFTHRYAHALRPPPLSPASIAPLVSTSTTPAISWLSESLPLACKALLLDAFKLSSMAVPYLLSFGWRQRYKI